MGWTRKFAQDHVYMFSISVTTIAIVLLYLSNFWLFRSTGGLDYDLNRVFAYLVPLVFIVVVCYLSGHIRGTESSKKGFGIGILLGWPFIVVGVFDLVSSYLNANMSKVAFPSIQKVGYFTLVMLLIGVFEEVLCRGVILNSMLSKWGSTRTGIVKSLVLSSLIFGLGHFVNLFVFPGLVVRTISQVIRSSLHGFLFASIYVRCKNLWSIVTLHAVYDWLVLVPGIFHPVVPSTAPMDTSIVSGLISVLFALPFALIGFYMLRNVSDLRSTKDFGTGS